MHRLAHSLILLVLLVVFPATSIYSHSEIHLTKTQEVLKLSDFTEEMTYDQLLCLLDAIESGRIERECSALEQEKIGHFIAFLATKGMLSNEDNGDLQDDISELLNGQESAYTDTLCQMGGKFNFLPALSDKEFKSLYARGWFSKRYKHCKNFVKKHKKALIIGAIVVVSVVVVVTVVAVASAAAGAAAAGAAGAMMEECGTHEISQIPENDEEVAAATPLTETLITTENDTPTMQAVINEHITVFKESVVDEDLLQITSESQGHEEAALCEMARNLGAILAHETLDGISQLAACIPKLAEEIKEVGQMLLPESFLLGTNETNAVEKFEKLVTSGHEKIDLFFGTERAEHYTPEAKEARSQIAICMIPFPNFGQTELAAAGRALDRAGFTVAGRSLMKHGYREGSVFPRPIGSPRHINEHGQRILESILNHPERTDIAGEFGRHGKVVDIFAPGIGGVRYSHDGKFIHFLEPKGR